MATTQMSFAEIGTLYNTISNELEGGVTPQSQTLLLNQVTTVQTQIQGLVDGGVFNNLIDDAGNPTPVPLPCPEYCRSNEFLKTGNQRFRRKRL